MLETFFLLQEWSCRTINVLKERHKKTYRCSLQLFPNRRMVLRIYLIHYGGNEVYAKWWMCISHKFIESKLSFQWAFIPMLDVSCRPAKSIEHIYSLAEKYIQRLHSNDLLSHARTSQCILLTHSKWTKNYYLCKAKAHTCTRGHSNTARNENWEQMAESAPKPSRVV